MLRRKTLRLSNFDYSSSYIYFVTICTKCKKHYFGQIIHEKMELSLIGMIANQLLLEMSNESANFIFHSYVVMPNHIHIVIEMKNNMSNLVKIIGHYKSLVIHEICKRKLGRFAWQRSFHDHIIRNEISYRYIIEYVQNNPLKWHLDSLYTECKITEI